MKYLILVFALLLPFFTNAQKVKGVVTYINSDAIKKPNFGEKVYIVPCAGCTAKQYSYIVTYTLKNATLRAREYLISIGGTPDGDMNVSSDTQKIYQNKIEALIKKSKYEASVDAAGNYSVENIARGRYIIIAESEKCDGYQYKVVDIKGVETINFDTNFICF